MIEILKLVEKCKIYWFPRKSEGWALDEKICLGGWDLPNFEGLPWGCVHGDGITGN